MKIKKIVIPQTGSPELDSDLKDLFQFAESEKKQELSRATVDRALSEEKLRELVPVSVLALTYTLTDHNGFENLLHVCPKSVHPFLKQARLLANKEFRKVLTHPAVLSVLKQDAEKRQSDDKPRLNLNVISKMSWIVEWVGKPPKLTPSIRVGFRDRRNNILLDTSMDWDDAFYLIEGMADILARQFRDGEALAKAKLLDLSDATVWSKKLKSAQANLQQIAALGPKYGIDVNSADASQEGEEPHR